MPRANFTDRKIVSLKKPKTGQVDYFDEGTKGFGIRVSQGGTKTWFLKFFLNNKQGRWRLGEYPALALAEARKKALAGKHDVMHGINPSIQQRIEREALTFKELAEKFVEEHGKAKKRTWAEDQRILNKYFAPFHDRKAGDIHRLEIHDRLQDIKRAHGSIMANRALACVRKAYSFGVRSGSVDDNPALLVDAPSEEADRDRVYNEDEIQALWKAFDDRGVHGAAFKLCLVTGQRLGEVSGLSRAEISDDIWELPGSRTKNGLNHVVPLSDLAQQIVHETDERHDSEWVFRSPLANLDQPIRSFSKASSDIKEMSGVPDFRSHDLRRTFATEITSLGFTRFLAERLLNHIEPGVGSTYDRYSYLKEKTEVTDAWCRRLSNIIGVNEKVVQLNQQA